MRRGGSRLGSRTIYWDPSNVCCSHTGFFSSTSLVLTPHPAPLLPHHIPFLNSHLSPQALRSKSPWPPLLGFPDFISPLIFLSQRGRRSGPSSFLRFSTL